MKPVAPSCAHPGVDDREAGLALPSRPRTPRPGRRTSIAEKLASQVLAGAVRAGATARRRRTRATPAPCGTSPPTPTACGARSASIVRGWISPHLRYVDIRLDAVAAGQVAAVVVVVDGRRRGTSPRPGGAACSPAVDDLHVRRAARRRAAGRLGRSAQVTPRRGVDRLPPAVVGPGALEGRVDLVRVAAAVEDRARAPRRTATRGAAAPRRPRAAPRRRRGRAGRRRGRSRRRGARCRASTSRATFGTHRRGGHRGGPRARRRATSSSARSERGEVARGAPDPDRFHSARVDHEERARPRRRRRPRAARGCRRAADRAGTTSPRCSPAPACQPRERAAPQGVRAGIGHNGRVSDLIDTTEMYLRTIYELDEEGIVPLRARIAERLHQSGPTVSQTVARMERDGLLTVEGDRHLELTDEGHRLAIRVMRKHRLAERLLTDVIGLPWELVHAEACRWEHVMSEAVERRLLELLDQPTESPYGNPIPGLAELGAEAGEDVHGGGRVARPRSVTGGRGGAGADPADQRGGPEGRDPHGRAAPGRAPCRTATSRRPRAPRACCVGSGGETAEIDTELANARLRPRLTSGPEPSGAVAQLGAGARLRGLDLAVLRRRRGHERCRAGVASPRRPRARPGRRPRRWPGWAGSPR